MKSSSIVAIIASVFLVALVAVLMNVEPAVAQRGEAVLPAPATSAPRYQISSYAGAVAGTGILHHGCYVVDTTTGAVWHVAKGSKVEVVVEKLP